MKKLLFIFALLLASFYSLAQDLTPEMLVGEYEGEVQIVYEDSPKPIKDNKATLSISKMNDSDTLLLDYFADEVKYDIKAIVVNNDIIIFHDKAEDKKIFIKYTKAKNYEGDIIKSQEFGSFNPDKKILSVSFMRIITVSDLDETSTKYFYLEMKKK